MIWTIALGNVLAVILLACLPLIIAACCFILALILAIIDAIISWLIRLFKPLREKE
jgi:hypothetical protein